MAPRTLPGEARASRPRSKKAAARAGPRRRRRPAARSSAVTMGRRGQEAVCPQQVGAGHAPAGSAAPPAPRPAPARGGLVPQGIRTTSPAIARAPSATAAHPHQHGPPQQNLGLTALRPGWGRPHHPVVGWDVSPSRQAHPGRVRSRAPAAAPPAARAADRRHARRRRPSGWRHPGPPAGASPGPSGLPRLRSVIRRAERPTCAMRRRRAPRHSSVPAHVRQVFAGMGMVWM